MEESCFKKSPTRNKSETPECSELFIGKTPGNSSSGFANTFRILENQIKRKVTRHSSLSSISEEEPSPFELELAARSRLSEICDTNVFKSEPAISLTKLDSVQNFIYHVVKSKSGAVTLKSKHLTPSSSNPIDEHGKLKFLFGSKLIKTMFRLLLM